MKCDNCKTNEAMFHMTQIVNGHKQELQLCEGCVSLTNAKTMSDLFKGLFDSGYVETQKCPDCGLSLESFRKVGKLGCAKCYEVFRPQLAQLIKNIHLNNVHTGKYPSRQGKQMSIRRQRQELKQKLSKAIQTEEYEEAAKLRDMIKELPCEEGFL